ncbi:TonB-dependent receptor [Dasania marina]|uniref:TonB-dependent receptor n=1 Tax=Dasania marina TaxID=471499 RepID=UPI0030D914A3|tara:strand:- start:29565 stop:32150 length:2586 start_codon:yes stop_codon:yes gene_type:complete
MPLLTRMLRVYAQTLQPKALLWGLCAAAVVAQAAGETKVDFHISKQPLAAALQQYAKQADMQLLFPSRLVAGIQSRALFGEHSPQQALALLLECHGLEAVFGPLAAVAIKSTEAGSGCAAEHSLSDVASGGQPAADSLEEIYVTAQKRFQSAQNVSMAITVFQAADVKSLGLQKAGDIAPQSSGVTIKNVLNKTFPVYTVRGVGSTAFTSNGSAPIGVYMDELFMPSISMLNFSLFDIERVEVLKGPQGTLFGRNTTGGAVRYISQRPQQEFNGSVSLLLADHDVRVLEAAVGGGLGDNLSARLAVKSEYQGEGYVTNKIHGRSQDVGRTNSTAMRLGLRWQEDDVDIYWNLHGGKENSQNEPWVGIGKRSPDVSQAAAELPGGKSFKQPCADLTSTKLSYFIDNCVNVLGYQDPYSDPRVGEYSQEPTLQGESLGSVLEIEKEFAWLRLTAITAAEYSDSQVEEDFDGGPFRIGDSSYSNTANVLSQELRISSINPAFGSTNWLAGFIYYQDDMQVQDIYGYRDRVNHDVLVEFDQKTTSWALFTHAETQLNYHWSVLAGLRYSYDESRFDGGTSIINKDIDYSGEETFFSEQPLLNKDQTRSREVTGKLVLQYSPQDHLLFYGSVNRGYKAGVWNGFWSIQKGEHNSTEPEHILAYELGVKSALANNTLQLNAALYYYDYTDMQLFFEFSDGRYTSFNAGEGEMKGAELEWWWRASEYLDIKGGVAYNRSKINGEVGTSKFSDTVPPNSPEYSANSLIRYSQPISAQLNGFVQADVAYQDEVYFSLDNQQAVSEKAYLLGNVSMGVAALDDSWDASIWVKNITDKQYYSEILSSNSAGTVSAQLGQPRTLGVSLSYRWH